MCAFVVLGLVFPYQAKRLAWERLQNDLFCVEWDVKPQLSQSNQNQLRKKLRATNELRSTWKIAIKMEVVIYWLCTADVRFRCHKDSGEETTFCTAGTES